MLLHQNQENNGCPELVRWKGKHTEWKSLRS